LLTCNSIKDINTHCLEEFKAHADCLENNNHYQFECRKPEMSLNKCVFDKLVRRPVLPAEAAYTCISRKTRKLTMYFSVQGLKKTIPGAPENQVPVHLRPKQVYAQFPGRQY
jgi:NADH dehydrogenase (ubiquinone) 1 alpha subcomplex subunit 8